MSGRNGAATTLIPSAGAPRSREYHSDWPTRKPEWGGEHEQRFRGFTNKIRSRLRTEPIAPMFTPIDPAFLPALTLPAPERIHAGGNLGRWTDATRLACDRPRPEAPNLPAGEVDEITPSKVSLKPKNEPYSKSRFTVPSGAPSATPADVVYSIEPLIFFFNKLIQTTFIYLNAVTCAFELVVQPINVLRLFPSQVLGV
jgi:hypothetical protein